MYLVQYLGEQLRSSGVCAELLFFLDGPYSYGFYFILWSGSVRCNYLSSLFSFYAALYTLIIIFFFMYKINNSIARIRYFILLCGSYTGIIIFLCLFIIVIMSLVLRNMQIAIVLYYTYYILKQIFCFFFPFTHSAYAFVLIDNFLNLYFVSFTLDYTTNRLVRNTFD